MAGYWPRSFLCFYGPVHKNAKKENAKKVALVVISRRHDESIQDEL